MCIRDRALDAERQRIYGDLHDDVGSRLLTLLHRVPASEQPLVREILQDLRAILSRERSIEGSLLEVLAQLRDETEPVSYTHLDVYKRQM